VARLTDRKVIYFIAGVVPTAPELAAIAAIEGQIFIRNASDATATRYGAKIEPCDAVAGAPIPTAYNGKPVATPNDASLPATSAVLANGATVSLRNSAAGDAHPGTAVVAANAVTGINITAATTAFVDNADAVSVRNSAGTDPHPGTAVVAAGLITGVNLAATVAMVDTGDALTGVAPTGTYTSTVTFTVAAGVITAITLS
jgi:hypothetical protein